MWVSHEWHWHAVHHAASSTSAKLNRWGASGINKIFIYRRRWLQPRPRWGSRRRGCWSSGGSLALWRTWWDWSLGCWLTVTSSNSNGWAQRRQQGDLKCDQPELHRQRHESPRYLKKANSSLYKKNKSNKKQWKVQQNQRNFQFATNKNYIMPDVASDRVDPSSLGTQSLHGKS